ncbi:unnamed protein product [Urochloa humidicola]
MLFILVMDVLYYMVKKAVDEDLLQPLARRALHRVSLYADDVVLFLKPSTEDIGITLEILELFGNASGLKTNIQKSSVLPIQGDQQDKDILQLHLPCQLLDFPCKYLGAPLSLHKLTKEQIQPIIDRIADQLPGWKADLLTRAGRKILVQFVLTSMLIYLFMAVEFPPWAIKAIDKIRRGFLWKGRKDAKGGHCLLAWPKVTRPPGLGWALRMRWLWLQKTQPDKTWAFLPIEVHQSVKSFFSVAITSEVGNGRNTIFWTDRWVHGKSLEKLVPHLFGAIPTRARKRTVHEALTDMRWVTDIKGALTLNVLWEYFGLWHFLAGFELQPEVEDSHIWLFSSSGKYSAKSAYEAMFIGSTQFRPWERIWKSWAPNKCKFFMWLVAHDRCWTADRLARKGLQHPEKCPHCDQEQETIDHLLLSCVFARQVWYVVLQRFGLQALAPHLEDISFEDWWHKVSTRVNGQTQRGLNSIIILVSWEIWKHRNRCVFDATQPNLRGLLLAIRDELQTWDIAGARGIAYLLALLPTGQGVV